MKLLVNSCSVFMHSSLYRIHTLLWFISRRTMCDASKTFEHVKKCRKRENGLPNSWIVVRLDGRSFTRFTELHNFEKPNDRRALELMNRAAAKVMEELKDISLAFGQSDEYSFVFKKNTSLFDRDCHTLTSVVNSLFTAAYVYYWDDFFAHNTKLLYPPGFDGRVVIYPDDVNLRDYLSWRQADVHINNLYNTVFWTLVLKGNHDKRKAQEILSGTVSSDKNDILFKDYGINYNNEPQLFRKGTTLIRKFTRCLDTNELQENILLLNCDIIGAKFWKDNPEVLSLQPPQIYTMPEGMKHYVVGDSNMVFDSLHHPTNKSVAC